MPRKSTAHRYVRIAGHRGNCDQAIIGVKRYAMGAMQDDKENETVSNAMEKQCNISGHNWLWEWGEKKTVECARFGKIVMKPLIEDCD